MDTQTYRQTHRATTVTLAVHARRGLITHLIITLLFHVCNVDILVGALCKYHCNCIVLVCTRLKHLSVTKAYPSILRFFLLS